MKLTLLILLLFAATASATETVIAHPQIQDIKDILQTAPSIIYLDRLRQEAMTHSNLSLKVEPFLNIIQPGLQRESKVFTYRECQQQVCEVMERKFLFHLAQVEWNYRFGSLHQIDILPVEITIQSEITYRVHEIAPTAPTAQKQSLKIINHRFY
jgi:hypothetical protein